MTRVRNFVADLATAGKSYKEIKETSDIVYGDKSLKKTAIYANIKKVNLNQYCLLWDFKCPQIKLISIVQKPKTNHNKHNISSLVYV